MIITCSITSSCECSVSKSLTRSCRTWGWSSWWHVLICKQDREVRSSELQFLKPMQRSLLERFTPMFTFRKVLSHFFLWCPSFPILNNAELTKPNNRTERKRLISVCLLTYCECYTFSELDVLPVAKVKTILTLQQGLCALLPHPIMPDELECDQSAAGSIVVLTLSNPPTLIHPLPRLGTCKKRDHVSTGA